MLFFTNRHSLAALLAIGLFASGCNRDSVPTMEQQLVGRWEWQQTASESEPALTPSNTGHHMVIEFDHRGRACFYQDGNLLSAAAFTVKHKRGGFRKPGRHIIQYRGYESGQYYSVSNNILYLEEMRGKVTHHSYVRLPAQRELSIVSPTSE